MQQISIERVYDYSQLGGQCDPQGIVQEIGIWPYEQMVYTQPWICPEKWDKLLWDF